MAMSILFSTSPSDPPPAVRWSSKKSMRSHFFLGRDQRSLVFRFSPRWMVAKNLKIPNPCSQKTPKSTSGSQVRFETGHSPNSPRISSLARNPEPRQPARHDARNRCSGVLRAHQGVPSGRFQALETAARHALGAGNSCSGFPRSPQVLEMAGSAAPRNHRGREMATCLCIGGPRGCSKQRM